MTDQVEQVSSAVSEAVTEKVSEHVSFLQWFWHNVLWKPGTGAMLWGGLLRVVFAALLWWVGTRLIRKILGLSLKPKMQLPVDRTMRRFLLNATRTALYALLVLAVIVVLGIPMASVTAVVASTGVTLGLAMQGALSNLAGGIIPLQSVITSKPHRSAARSMKSGCSTRCWWALTIRKSPFRTAA